VGSADGPVTLLLDASAGDGLRLVGRVVDADGGEPIAGAEISLLPLGDEARGSGARRGTPSDAEGRFEVSLPGAGRRLAVVQAPGRAAGVRIVDGTEGDLGEVALAGTRTLALRVVDGDGAALPEATVQARLAGGDRTPLLVDVSNRRRRSRVAVDGAGRAVLHGLPRGALELEVSTPHRVSPWTFALEAEAQDVELALDGLRPSRLGGRLALAIDAGEEVQLGEFTLRLRDGDGSLLLELAASRVPRGLVPRPAPPAIELWLNDEGRPLQVATLESGGGWRAFGGDSVFDPDDPLGALPVPERPCVLELEAEGFAPARLELSAADLRRGRARLAPRPLPRDAAGE
jgi:hypothetical protein